MKYLAIILFSLVLGSCAVKVNTMQDNSVDFSQYKTFCWLQGCEFTYSGPSYLNDSLLQETVKGAITAELAEKGIIRDDNNPDLLIDFHITLENETSVIYEHIDKSYDYQPLPEVNNEIIHYLKGTMIIDMVDKAQPKWCGDRNLLTTWIYILS